MRALRSTSTGISTRSALVATAALVSAAVVIGKAATAGRPDTNAAPAKRVAAVQTASAAELPIIPPPTSAPAVNEASPHVATQQAPPVTLTGCLERDADVFRLKDASGDAAPKARSWKSGFFRKSPAPIEIVDAPKALRLPAHVGERVSVTGTLVDREMRVRTVRRVAASCSQKS